MRPSRCEQVCNLTKWRSADITQLRHKITRSQDHNGGYTRQHYIFWPPATQTPATPVRQARWRMGGDMGYSLLIDGDDTLWENNIYFERAIADFIAFLDHATLNHDEVRAVLDEIEAAQGYGSANFATSLQIAYARLVEREMGPEDLDYLAKLGRQVGEHPLELVAGVHETLDYLAGRHNLFLVTKGIEDEQRLKIDASGLALHFQHIVIVPEKDRSTYTTLIERFELDPARTWMI